MVTFTGGNCRIISNSEAGIRMQYGGKIVDWIQRELPKLAPSGDTAPRRLVELQALCAHFTVLGNTMPSKKQCHQYLSAYRRHRNPQGMGADSSELRALRIHLKVLGIKPSNKHQEHRLDEARERFIKVYRRSPVETVLGQIASAP